MVALKVRTILQPQLYTESNICWMATITQGRYRFVRNVDRQMRTNIKYCSRE